VTACHAGCCRPPGAKNQTYLVIVKGSFMLCVRPPPVPVIVNVKVPRLPPVWMVRIDCVPEADEVTDWGLKLAVVPDGSPLTLRLTNESETLVVLTVTVSAPLLLRRIDSDVGLAERLKSGAAVKVTVAVWPTVTLSVESVAV
jgi:hypothetical protein